MARVVRLKNTFGYFTAILVIGLFGFFGKSAPTWAQEKKQEHHSKVFNENFFATMQDSEGTQVADNRSFTKGDENRAFTKSNKAFTVNRSFTMRDFTIDSSRAFTFKRSFTSPESIRSVNDQLSNMVEIVRRKVQNNQTLTPGEMSLLIQIENMRIIDSQQSRIKKIESE